MVWRFKVTDERRLQAEYNRLWRSITENGDCSWIRFSSMPKRQIWDATEIVDEFLPIQRVCGFCNYCWDTRIFQSSLSLMFQRVCGFATIFGTHRFFKSSLMIRERFMFQILYCRLVCCALVLDMLWLKCRSRSIVFLIWAVMMSLWL